MAEKTKTLAKLRCEQCKRINYYKWKKKSADFKLNLKKFCRYCRRHLPHKEVRK
ncbi:MAG: hypothetical protein KatS3mg097_316 [Candidatus Parcubacteria bacterium]|nr:MAG: hypothetical protein KatS3mg097_316 [Candidatus Parcubacteria bacterium]